jgi:very-short-patch-repair endonuclease
VDGRRGGDHQSGNLSQVENPELFELAKRQQGLFTWKQARAAGYSAWQVNTRLRDRRWRRVLGPTLTAGHGVDSPSALDLAAYLAAGEPAVLSGPSAARVYGIAIDDVEPCITVPRSRHLTLPGVTQLRGRVDDNEAVLIDGALVTIKSRTAVDCLRLLPPDAALAFLDRALQQRWISAESLARRAATGDQLRGIAQLKELAREAATGTHSEAERRTAALFSEHGIRGWGANFEVRVNGSLLAVVDFAFPVIRLAIEVDGRAWHVDRDRFQRDRERQNSLVNAGWTVLRFTWEDVTEDPARVVAEVNDALARLAA